MKNKILILALASALALALTGCGTDPEPAESTQEGPDLAWAEDSTSQPAEGESFGFGDDAGEADSNNGTGVEANRGTGSDGEIRPDTRPDWAKDNVEDGSGINAGTSEPPAEESKDPAATAAESDPVAAEAADKTGLTYQTGQVSVEMPPQLAPEDKKGFSSEDSYKPGASGANLQSEAVALSSTPGSTVSLDLKPTAPGTMAEQTDDCAIDWSNFKDGYWMARWSGPDNKIKAQSTGPSGTTYTYDLTGHDYTAFPFSDGNGTYRLRIMENVGGTKYAVALSIDVLVEMKDEFAPFLWPNQYVDWSKARYAKAMAADLCKDLGEDELKKVAAVYDYVIGNMTYDYDKAANVKSGYLPDIDTCLQAGKGICFDYAAVMSGMLRSQGVPCKLVVGYVGNAYHAWISVYVKGQGWVDGAIYFDGTSWQRMDPTFASSAGNDPGIVKYIGDGSNYSAKYLY